MSFLAVIITLFLEQQKLLRGIRIWFNRQMSRYVDLFTNRDFITVREIRLYFIYAVIPFLILTILLMMLPLIRYHIPYFLINSFLYLLCVDILGWKEEAKQTNRSSEFQQFIQTYATRFFATTFWFIILPSVLGALCYLVLTAIGNKLRARSEESLVYSVVVDKMLFWINILPYSVLIIFIAAAGDFEAVMHYALEQRDKIKLSFFYLENILNDITFIAINKDKFANADQLVETEVENPKKPINYFDPKVVDYVVALLYRSGLFFIITISVISIIMLF